MTHLVFGILQPASMLIAAFLLRAPGWGWRYQHSVVIPFFVNCGTPVMIVASWHGFFTPEFWSAWQLMLLFLICIPFSLMWAMSQGSALALVVAIWVWMWAALRDDVTSRLPDRGTQ